MVFGPCVDYGVGGGIGNYADCYPRNGGCGGGHHFYESIKNELESFRLRSADGDFSAVADMLLNDDTSSIASKKRIDSMFKTPASVAGDDKRGTADDGRVPQSRRARSLAADDDHYRGGDCFDYRGYGATGPNDKNTVQEKIEKMFAEVSSSELDTDMSMDAVTVASSKYHVQYIGCAGLSGKISSLEGLQQPVRDMYFGYRENRHGHATDTERRRDFSGLLEISTAGLTIRYRDELGDTVHRTNPFPSIAVWAALKYVCRRQSPQPQRRTSNTDGDSAVNRGYEYAFLPLIADPDGSDKAPLFRDMDPGDRARMDAAGDHAPVFAVVTRETGKRLECHGFACETENDALLMAANLYGALVKAMSSAVAANAAQAVTADDGTAKQQVTPAPRRVIRQRNGFTSMSSTAGSSVAGGDVAPALPPPRPPRRNKKAASSAGSSTSGEQTSAIVADDLDVCSDAKTFRMSVKQPPSLRRGVCNSSGAVTVTDGPTTTSIDTDEPIIKRQSDIGGGDIFTRVAIPRSKSFLSSNGLASGKYSRRATGCGIETAMDRYRRRSNSSGVMGFSDMFNELRVQEGLNNMDDILNAIINVEGMSYNDLKPIYREFLMKLSMALTKDELYQRTKTIMTEQKRKRNKRRPTAVAPSAAAAVNRGRRLNDKLRNALNLRTAKSRIGAIFLPDFCKREKQRKPTFRKPRRCSCSASNGSEIRPFAPKPERPNQRRGPAGGKRAAVSKPKTRRNVASSPVCSTSDDSDFFAAAALRQRQHQIQQQQQQLYRKSKARTSKIGGRGRNGRSAATAMASEGSCLHRASSGYFSCSECSAGAADDKCYCGRADIPRPASTSMVSCSCDSDSCADSDKCYCGRSRRPRNIFDELKSRGFAASESSVSRADSPGTAWKKNEQMLMMMHERHDSRGPSGSSFAATGVGGIEPSKSLEYLQVARRPAVDQHYSSVAKAKTAVVDRMKVYGGDGSPADGSTSSSLSAATVYSSSSAHLRHRKPHRRSGSSGSDNFRAIDYTLFANNGVGRKARGCSARQSHHYRPSTGYSPPGDGRRSTVTATAAISMNRRSYSSEAVHLTGCQVYHHQQTRTTATRRHSVHDGGAGKDVLSSFFKSGIENSLGYYP